MTRILVLSALILASAFGQNGIVVGSRICSGPRLSSVLRDSTAIVVATVSNATTSGRRLFVDLRVARVLKGELFPNQSVLLDIEATPQPWANGAYGLWFLTKDHEHWTTTPAQTCSHPALDDFFIQATAEPAPSIAPRSSESYDLALDEIVASIRAGHGVHFGYLGLDFPNEPKVASVLRQLAEDPNLSIHVRGVEGLIQTGDPSGYEYLLREPNIATSALCLAPRKASDIPVLTRLLDLPNSTAVACAAEVLRGLHSRETVPILARLLDHTDLAVRYSAIAGLASFANNLPVNSGFATANWTSPVSEAAPYLTSDTQKNFPSRPEYERNPASYENFWKSWWLQNQHQLTTP